jgi:voltage-gated potassium channel
MIRLLLVALVLTSATVTIHAIGTVYLVLPMSGIWARAGAGRKIREAALPLIRLVSGLLVLHLIEMSIWAAAFAALGVFPDLDTALYYSFKSYTTVGYGDVLPPTSWRLIGPIEAAVGVLMLGWSTGFIVAAVQRIYNDRLAGSRRLKN